MLELLALIGLLRTTEQKKFLRDIRKSITNITKLTFNVNLVMLVYWNLT